MTARTSSVKKKLSYKIKNSYFNLKERNNNINVDIHQESDPFNVYKCFEAFD